ncbi:hypothetical protein EKE94_03750 [Mesobaculum littorinae]|uniref:Uncharacterized protein n=1 Tax=Mesobaculum littorinae TaxID=2486419 RepID=A0A438AM16_9RHOB|nr:hypothetical protein [Mesobaculum littorinae]RVV99798.1 hypothetical protein EKE94_03750 [Mesobaculum littorinae]
MQTDTQSGADFNIVVVGQSGRLGYEAALFAASLRRSDPGFRGRLFVAEPQPGPLWPEDPRISDPALRHLLTETLGAEILPFPSRAFGAAYPYGNKIEALTALPDAPFVFFDSDTLITGPLSQVPFDFDRPSASLRRTGTWPEIELYGPGYTQIWCALYDRFGLDFDSSLDLSQPDEYWRRYLYFNAGWFFHRSPQTFGQRFLDYATAIRDAPPAELVCQSMDPWLDQIALPLVIHSFGGGRQTIPDGLLDGEVSCHYRLLPLLYAREPEAVVTLVEELLQDNKIKKVLKAHEPMQRMILQGRGRKVRALFDQDDLPRREEQIRRRIKRAKLWMR